MRNRNRGIRRTIVAIFLTLACRFAVASGEGIVIERQIRSESLRQNKIGTDVMRRMAIYLPPGYETSEQRYPVIYMLPSPIGSYRADFDRHDAAKVFDRAISKGILPPCIIVVADFTTPLGPSWYVNSPVTGNWDDFAVRELVPYMDASFRTLARSSSRAILGDFIGAYGALRLGMLHPDVFGIVYAMHPVGTGSGVQVMTSRPDWALLQSATSMDQVKGPGFSALFLSMFQAFLPDIGRAPLYADLPVEASTGSSDVDARRMLTLRSHFFIAELVPQNLSHLAALRALKMDWPRNDSIYDHVYANQALTHLLNEYGIEHEAEEFNGMGDDPYWGKNPRMLTDVLPFLAEHLQVDQK
jgi:enterochelin esterase-like enzyme